jgi:hypothetical protein
MPVEATVRTDSESPVHAMPRDLKSIEHRDLLVLGHQGRSQPHCDISCRSCVTPDLGPRKGFLPAGQ